MDDVLLDKGNAVSKGSSFIKNARVACSMRQGIPARILARIGVS